MPSTEYESEQEFRRSLGQRFFLRWHMTFILSGILFAGIIADRTLFSIGVTVPVYRYCASVLFSYLTFFFLVRIWCAFLFRYRASSSNALDSASRSTGNVLRLFNFSSGTSVSKSSKAKWSGGGGGSGGAGASASWAGTDPVAPVVVPVPMESSAMANESSNLAIGDIVGDAKGDKDALFLVLFIAAIAVLFGAGIYLVVSAPTILADAGFHFALATGFIRPSRKMRQENWMENVFKHTWLAFLLVFTMALIIGGSAALKCPKASTGSEIYQQCFLKAKT